MSVQVERILEDEETVGVALVVAGKVVDEGFFGGEPEDNCECRDYAWVIPMLERAIKEERDHCAKICADRAARLHATADQYPAGTAACFAAEAAECERLIRG